MIYRQEIEEACFGFANRSAIRVAPQVIELIRALLNAVIYDSRPTDRGDSYEARERRILSNLRDEVAGVLDEVATSQRVDSQIDALHFLHWLAPKIPDRVRSIRALSFAFDKQ